MKLDILPTLGGGVQRFGNQLGIHVETFYTVAFILDKTDIDFVILSLWLGIKECLTHRTGLVEGKVAFLAGLALGSLGLTFMQ